MIFELKNLEDLRIRICKDSSSCISYAAKQLQTYFTKITGYQFMITSDIPYSENGFVLLFGASLQNDEPEHNMFDSILDDGFTLSGSGTCIAVRGKTARGVLYGVYEYLERFYGARFLTNDFEHLPPSVHLFVPEEEILSNPDFTMRGYFTGDTYDDLSQCGTVDYAFAAKNRNKDIFMNIPPEFGGPHSVYGRNFVHNFHYYVPFEIYGNEHPEWYRFFYELGKITPTIDITNGITDDGMLDENMETSVAKVVIAEIIKDAEAHPEKNIFNFTQEDGPYYYESERADRLAETYKRSGLLVRFCNAVVRAVNAYLKKTYQRTIQIITFAYAYAREAPVKQVNNVIQPIDDTVIADDNLIIQLALFANGSYSYFSPKQDETVRRVMREWKTVAHHFWFWMYDINFHKYLYYYDSFDQIQENVREFQKYGISYLAVNGPLEEGRSWQCNIRAYAYRKLMWNTSLDAGKLMNEYLDLYYGPASSCVKKVLKKFRTNAVQCRKDSEYHLSTRGTCENAKYTSRNLLLEILDVIELGEKAIQNSGLLSEKQSIYAEHLYGVKATPLLMLYDFYFTHRPDGDLAEYLALKETFFDTVKKAKIHMAGEHWTMEQFRSECDEADRKAGRTAENLS